MLLHWAYEFAWDIHNPQRGQSYRAIRLNMSQTNVWLEHACHRAMFLSAELRLPQETTVWIDPNKVKPTFSRGYEGCFAQILSLTQHSTGLRPVRRVQRSTGASNLLRRHQTKPRSLSKQDQNLEPANQHSSGVKEHLCASFHANVVGFEQRRRSKMLSRHAR